MAKGNLLLGYSRGKIGDVVLTRFNGQQVARARNRNPKNPKSMGQLVQRMVLATVGQAASTFKSIVDHSFENKSNGLLSLGEFRRVNMAWLRSQALADINADGSGTGNYMIKGAAVTPVNRYIMSRGSVLYPEYTYGTINGVETALVPSWQNNYDIIQMVGNTSISSDISYKQMLSAFGLKPGDQLTFVGLVADRGNIAASYADNEAINVPSQMVVARLVFRDAPTDGSVANDWVDNTLASGGIMTFTDKVIDTDRSTSVDAIYIRYSNLTIGWSIGTVPYGSLDGIAIIVSRKDDNGKWLRSTSTMVVGGDIDAAAALVYNSYGEQSGADFASNLYLNNALTDTDTIAQTVSNPLYPASSTPTITSDYFTVNGTSLNRRVNVDVPVSFNIGIATDLIGSTKVTYNSNGTAVALNSYQYDDNVMTVEIPENTQPATGSWELTITNANYPNWSVKLTLTTA